MSSRAALSNSLTSVPCLISRATCKRQYPMVMTALPGTGTTRFGVGSSLLSGNHTYYLHRGVKNHLKSIHPHVVSVVMNTGPALSLHYAGPLQCRSFSAYTMTTSTNKGPPTYGTYRFHLELAGGTGGQGALVSEIRSHGTRSDCGTPPPASVVGSMVDPKSGSMLCTLLQSTYRDRGALRACHTHPVIDQLAILLGNVGQ